MKIFFALIFLQALVVCDATEDKVKKLAELLYTLEDKVDHLLFHYSHDVTKHEYQATPFGTFLAPKPKNKNSIHQKLKLVDYLNHQMGHPNALAIAANNAMDMGLGVPGAPNNQPPMGQPLM